MTDAIRPDPTGYRIVEEGGGWVAYRLTDDSRVDGDYATREEALAATDEDRDAPEEPRH